MRDAMRIALVMALVLAGCSRVGGGGVGGRQNSWTHPHVLTFADAGDVNTLNPMFSQFADVGFISQLTMAWLIRWDEHNRPVPELLTEIPTKQNGGISADDVVFSIKAVLNPQNIVVGRDFWELITKVDEPDKYTVVLHLKRPYSPFIVTYFSTAGANPCILPAHLLARYPDINHVPYNAKPVGIGPFKVERWDRSQDVVLVANPLYWRGRPKLDKIIFKIIPDRNTLLAQLESHDVDLWDLVPGNYLQRVGEIPGYRILRQPSYYWNNMSFNITHAVVKDRIVREALLYATNRQEIVEKIAHGVGHLSDSPTPIDAPYAVKAPPHPFDLAKANQLLDQAGWKIGKDGVREKDGVRLSIDFATNSGSADVNNMIELVRGDWQKIGVRINVRLYPVSMLFAPLDQGGIIYSNKYDAMFIAWQNLGIGDYSQIFGCGAFPPEGQNIARWCNPTAQAAMTAFYDHYDEAQQNQDVRTVVEQFVNDVPVIVMTQREDIYAYNSDIKNFHPNDVTPFDNFMNVDI
jgi:peptide/nickel transport system substrate-binding protein